MVDIKLLFVRAGRLCVCAVLIAGITVSFANGLTITQLEDGLDTLIEDPFHNLAFPNLFSPVIIPFDEFNQTVDLFQQTMKERLKNFDLWYPSIRLPLAKRYFNGFVLPQNVYLQKVILDRQSVVAVFGDIHGAAHSLFRLLQYLKNGGYIDENFTIIRDNFYMIFLGDYIDRGYFSTEVLYAVMRLKNTNPDHVFLLYGNHENGAMPETFRKELQERYKQLPVNQVASLIENLYNRVFPLLPSALFLGMANDHSGVDYILFCHGGIADGKTLPVRSFLLDKTKLFKAETINNPLENTYWWQYFADKQTGDITNLTIDTINTWLERNSSPEAIIHFIVRGHEHTGLEEKLDKNHGMYSFDNNKVYTIISAPTSDVWIPYDSFLLMSLVPNYADWHIDHIWRTVGYTSGELNAAVDQLYAQMQQNVPGVQPTLGLIPSNEHPPYMSLQGKALSGMPLEVESLPLPK